MKSGEFFVSLLQVAFIVLKIINEIKWSWWWVLSPIWISTLISLLIIVGYFIYISVKR